MKKVFYVAVGPMCFIDSMPRGKPPKLTFSQHEVLHFKNEIDARRAAFPIDGFVKVKEISDD